MPLFFGPGSGGARATFALLLLASAAAARSAFGQAAEGSVPTLDLNTCVAEAAASGPDFRLASANLEAARASRDQVAAKRAFGLGSSAGTSYSSNHASYTLPSGAQYSSQAAASLDPQAGLDLAGPMGTSLGLAASQAIPGSSNVDAATRISLNLSATLWDGYAGGQALGALRQADFDFAAKESQASDARRQAVYAVKQAYYALLGQQRQIDILQRSLDARTAEETRTSLLHDAKGASGIDLRQAHYNRLQAGMDLRKAQASVVVARQKLSALMGRPIDSVYAVREIEDLPAAPPEAADAVAAALAQRPELRQLELDAASGRVALALANSQYSPAIGTTGSMTFIQDETRGGGTTNWSLGLQMSLPLIDSGTLDAQRRQAIYQNEAYAAQREQTVASVSTDARSAVDSLVDLIDRVALSESGLELAQEQYELAKTQFETGTGTNLDLLNASVALSTAEVAAASAKSAAQMGELALENAIGK